MTGPSEFFTPMPSLSTTPTACDNAEAPDCVVDLNDVSKHFGGVRALQHVALQLRAGQVHCLAGENGSGKSTLIKVLAGVLQPDEGTISIGGRRIERLSPIASARLGIQVIYQDFSLFPNLTVLENLSLNSQLEQRRWLVNRRRMRSTAQRAMEQLGVTLPLAATVASLPVTHKQLVAIARALVQDARLIVLDEPTTALTHIEIEALFRIIRQLKQRGVSILFVSHKLREMLSISDHFTVLRNGQVAAEGPAAEFDASRITQCMTGRTIEDRRPTAQPSNAARAVLKAKHLVGVSIRDVTFTLDTGQIVGVTGLMGSGQTELALMLFGLQPCAAGQVTVEGYDHPIRSVRDALTAGIVYVPEDRLTEGLFLDQSITSNLVAADMKSIQGIFGLLSPKRIGRQADHWLRELAIQASSSSAAVATLSGGNQQRVVLAKWLSRKPRIMILNGPTVGVDIGSKERLHKKLRQLANQSMAVLMISDDLPELAENCDRVLVMHRGRVVKDISGDALTEESIGDYLNSLN